jgi:rod shape-determining protein MreB
MIVDIGGGTTDVAVISLGGIVNYVTLKVAGDKMDDSIIQYVRRRHNILVGERTAEVIKQTLGSAYPLPEERTMEIKGRDLISCVPKSIQITSQDIRDSLADVVRGILEAVKATLEKTPPELSGDISERGLVLAGGGAMLTGLDEVLREELGIPVVVSDTPLLAVVNGAGKVLEDLPSFRNLLM